MRDISLEERGYAAGILDGEGCIGIYKVFRNAKHSGYPAYRLWVIITNSNDTMIDWLAATFDFCNPCVTVRKAVDGDKPMHVVRFNDSNALVFLTTIMEHVIAKRPQLELAMDFIEFQKHHNYKGEQIIPDYVMSTREEFYQISKRLNRRGTNHAGD